MQRRPNETGAGKSIIVGALGFLLGERGNADLVRTGADKAAVEGVFDVSRLADVAGWADERGVDIEEGVLILKRELSSAGRGRAWVNGTPVAAATLSEIGRMLAARSRALPASAAELVELFDRGSEALEELARSAERHGERVELDSERLAQVREGREAIIRVQTGARGGVTTADVAVVAGGERVEEIARMLGGDPGKSRWPRARRGAAQERRVAVLAAR